MISLNKLAGLKNDFERYKSRTNSATDTAKDDGKIFVIEKLVPVLDTFDRAKESVTDEITIKALELILKQFEKVLNDIRIEEIEVLNQTFDPNFANAIVKQPVEEDTKKGVVLTVIAKGFKYKGKIIRYPQVIVGV
jgi:Molecular chaperone GrpE (heat shock protein)